MGRDPSVAPGVADEFREEFEDISPDGGRSPIQRKAYSLLISASKPHGWAALINRRAISLGTDCPAEVWEKIATSLRALPLFVAMCAMKTLTCSWTTSCRMHSRYTSADDLKCMFGCAGAKDDICHYRRCVPFKEILIEAGFIIPCEEVWHYSEDRNVLIRAAGAHLCYHRARFSWHRGRQYVVDWARTAAREFGLVA